MDKPKIYKILFSSVYPLYIQKAEKKAEQNKKLMRLFIG
jgi:hypothetical protein